MRKETDETHFSSEPRVKLFRIKYEKQPVDVWPDLAKIIVAAATLVWRANSGWLAGVVYFSSRSTIAILMTTTVPAVRPAAQFRRDIHIFQDYIKTRRKIEQPC
jgi:hypothetical protein